VYKKKDGRLFPCEINTKYYQRDGKGHVIAYVRDVSEQVAYEEKIEQSLKEKSTLLAEVHHRVKNNLAVISGLLEMQTFNTEDKQVARKLKESQSRIQSIATVHEKLYQSESFSDITLDSYIQDLVSYISNTFGNENTNVHFEKDIDPISLTVSQAIPCGLLLNELITNTYKHAFPEQNEGTIAISMHQKRNTAHLTVEDDGVGLPPDFDIEQSSSLGMTLISTLVQQLGGSLSIQSAPSTRFQISFDIVENQE
jgi:two-component sensor histidine kinase